VHCKRGEPLSWSLDKHLQSGLPPTSASAAGHSNESCERRNGTSNQNPRMRAHVLLWGLCAAVFLSPAFAWGSQASDGRPSAARGNTAVYRKSGDKADEAKKRDQQSMAAARKSKMVASAKKEKECECTGREDCASKKQIAEIRGMITELQRVLKQRQ